MEKENLLSLNCCYIGRGVGLSQHVFPRDREGVGKRVSLIWSIGFSDQHFIALKSSVYQYGKSDKLNWFCLTVNSRVCVCVCVCVCMCVCVCCVCVCVCVLCMCVCVLCVCV